MTQDEIIRMAREAGGIDFTNNNAWGATAWLGTGTPEFLERFATLVAAHEREACAKVCEKYVPGHEYLAAAIRARGEK